MQPTAVLTIWTMVILKSAFKHYISHITSHIRHMTFCRSSSTHTMRHFSYYQSHFILSIIALHFAVSHRLAFSIRLIAFSPSSHIACTHTYNSVQSPALSPHNIQQPLTRSSVHTIRIFPSHSHIPGVRRT